MSECGAYFFATLIVFFCIFILWYSVYSVFAILELAKLKKEAVRLGKAEYDKNLNFKWIKDDK